MLDCPVCHCAVYCSEECRQKNWNHEQICEKLVQVQQVLQAGYGLLAVAAAAAGFTAVNMACISRVQDLTVTH